MKQPRAPQLDRRRAKEFEAELFARARAWIPSWGMDDDARDFGRALLRIAARFHSEVAERLDHRGEVIHPLDRDTLERAIAGIREPRSRGCLPHSCLCEPEARTGCGSLNPTAPAAGVPDTLL